jgi:predicted ATP-dependent endonuclease of OLD family
LYSYSPIKKIRVKNFRNIGEVELDFTDSPIIALIGDNESGKTSIVKAFAVCALHANSRDQKYYIRDGTNGFGVQIELQDGTLITRIKTDTINKYTIQYPDGTVWDTNKIENEVPKEVRDVMGLIEEPETKEYLQVRTYEDKLLFVVTPASTNYKVMYNALKVEQITKAISIGSREVNTLKAKINNNEVSMDALKENLRRIKVYDIEPAINIRDRLKSQLQNLDKLERAKNIANRIDEAHRKLGALSLIDEYKLNEIDVARLDKFNNAIRLLNSSVKLNKLSEVYKDLSTIDSIDISVLQKLRGAIDRRNKIISDKQRMGILYDISKVKEIPESAVNSVFKLGRAIEIAKRLRQMEDVLAKAKDVISKIEDYLEKCGVTTTVCPNCGKAIIVDKDTLESCC